MEAGVKQSKTRQVLLFKYLLRYLQKNEPDGVTVKYRCAEIQGVNIPLVKGKRTILC